MITTVIAIAVLVSLTLLIFGIRSRQPRAMVAAFGVLATLFCWFNFAVSGQRDDQFAARIWLGASVTWLVLTGLLAFSAWRRSSGSR